MTRTLTFWLAAWTVALAAVPARADGWPSWGATPEKDNCKNLRERDPYSEGRCSIQFLSGYSLKASGGGSQDSSIDYTPQSFRLGYVLNTPDAENGCWHRGCWEVLLDAYYAPIVSGPGNYFAGPAGLLRYNFVQTDWLVVPYVQGGAGCAFNDAAKAPNQTQVGDSVEFLLRADVGAHLMVTECFSFDLEVGFQHLSNGQFAGHHSGLSHVGASLGFTYSFGR